MEINWDEKRKGILNKLLAQKKGESKNAKASLEKIEQTAIEAPGRMESRFDSTKQEYSYLANEARGAVEQNSFEIKQLEELAKGYTRAVSRNLIDNGSIIRAELDGQSRTYILLSFGGSEIIADEVLGIVNIISAVSPIGMLLLNKKAGDVVELNNKKIIIKEVH